jgi:hypothetical protein
MVPFWKNWLVSFLCSVRPRIWNGLVPFLCSVGEWNVVDYRNRRCEQA